MNFINSARTMHNLYVGAYECVGALTHGAWTTLQRPTAPIREGLSALHFTSRRHPL